MSDELQWSEEEDCFVLRTASGQEKLTGDEADFKLGQVGEVTLSSAWEAVMRRYSARDESDFEYRGVGVPARFGFGVTNDEPTRLHRMGTLPPLYVYLDEENDLVFSMTAGVGFYVSESEIRSLIGGVLGRWDATLIHVGIDEDGPNSEWWEYSLRIPWRDRTVAEIYRACLSIGTAIQFPSVEGLRPETLLEVLRAGYVDNLLGQRESDWLEVKARPYDFQHRKHHRLELPKDVARFANAEHGGLLLLGVEEEREVIVSIQPIRPDARRIQSYGDTLKDFLYPPVEGLRIEALPVDGGEILAILVPPQREGLKPFLVRGAVVAGREDMTYVTIVRRRGDKSIASSPEELHAWLSAGRAFLRQGE